MIAPWEVGSLPPRYLEAAQGLNSLKARRLRLQKARAQMEQVFSKWRNEHPAYKKGRA